MSDLDRLFTDLDAEGTVVERIPAAATGAYLISHYRGEVMDPPATLTVVADDLDALLARIESHNPQAVFPDRDRRTAAYFLFLANLDEEVARYDYKIKALTVSPTGVRGTPRDDWDPHPFLTGITAADLRDPGGYEWTTTRPGD